MGPEKKQNQLFAKKTLKVLLDEMAGDLMAGVYFTQHGPLRRLAHVQRVVPRHTVRTAWIEATAGRRITQIGR